jgi:4-carboxymuconolactone decarboxylase
MDDQQRRRRGTKTRRAVLGDAHVDRATRETTAFDRDFHDLITRYVWGEIWTRPGLPRRTRRLITLAMLVALNRGEELELHVRAAARDGVSADDIREVLLQAAVYCGVPAAHNAFRIAAAVLAEPRAKRRRSTRG